MNKWSKGRLVTVKDGKDKISDIARSFFMTENGDFYIPLSDFLSLETCLLLDEIETNGSFDEAENIDIGGNAFKRVDQIMKVLDICDDDEAEELVRRIEMTRDSALKLINDRSDF